MLNSHSLFFLPDVSSCSLHHCLVLWHSYVRPSFLSLSLSACWCCVTQVIVLDCLSEWGGEVWERGRLGVPAPAEPMAIPGMRLLLTPGTPPTVWPPNVTACEEARREGGKEGGKGVWLGATGACPKRERWGSLPLGWQDAIL